MNERSGVLLGLGLLAAAAIGGAIFASSSGGGPEEVAVVPAEAVVGASTGVTATATPRPEALRELPAAVWTEIEPEDTEEAGAGAYFLLDVETGKLYSPTEQVLGREQGAVAFFEWHGNGLALVYLLGLDGIIQGERVVYFGVPLGRMSPLPAGVNHSLSSTGLLAYYEEVLQNVVTNLALDQQVQQLPGQPWVIDTWSADGRYLALQQGDGPIPPEIAIWDVETERIVDRFGGVTVHWSNTSHRFLYRSWNAEAGRTEVWLRDPDSGEEAFLFATEEADFVWSPDDRYVQVQERYEDEEGHKYAVRVHDVEARRQLLTLDGAWAGTWLDEETLGFTGNVCDTYDFYTIRADGAELRKVFEPGQPWVVDHPSRQGDRVAFTLVDDELKATTVVLDLATGATREYATGDARLPFYPGQGSSRWSHDGRYLALHKPPGKGGPCEFDPPQRLEVEVH